MIVLRQLKLGLEFIIFDPNGHNINIPIFSDCNPKGIPIIVTIKRRLARKYCNAVSSPPNINQIKFPRNFIDSETVKR